MRKIRDRLYSPLTVIDTNELFLNLLQQLLPFERASSSTENAKARRTQGLLVEAPETSVEQAWWNTLDAAVFQQSEGGNFLVRRARISGDSD